MYNCGVSRAELNKGLEEKSIVEEPPCLIDELHRLDLRKSLQPTKLAVKSKDEWRLQVEPGATQAVPDFPSGGFASFSLTSPRKGPLPTPPISPRSRSPAVPETGRLTRAGAIRDSKMMAEQVQTIREEFRLAIEDYFWLWFADAKLLRKALGKMAASLESLHLELDLVSKPMLNEIELVDMHMGPVLQEGDRIIRVITKAGSNLEPLIGRPRSMRKSMIKSDLAPQMAALAENLQILERRVKSITQIVIAERNSAKARRDILTRAFSEKTLN